MTTEAPAEAAPSAPKKERLFSLDAFRGLTILGMVFVIAVAAGGYNRAPGTLPQQMSWFGSIPVSTWFHADVGYGIWERQLREAGLSDEEIKARPRYEYFQKIRNIGVTFTDLIAPWFVFIVGVCIPIGRPREGADWWRHVLERTALLVLAGMLYIALVVKQTSWWWGVLQAIGVAYFCGALMHRAPRSWHWPIVLVVGGINLLLTELWPFWTEAWEDLGWNPMTLSNPGGDWQRPLLIHCQPWLSVSYGVMTMIGVLVGHAVRTREPMAVLRTCLLVGGVYTVLGYTIHSVGFATENYSLAFSKPDVTTSYAFFTGGLGALAFLGFYWVIDVWKWRAWAWPLGVIGMNPLLAYFMMIIQRRVMESLGIIDFFNLVGEGNTAVMNWAVWIGGGEPSQAVLWFFDKNGYTGMFWGLVYTAILWAVVWYCNRRGWFWKF